MRQLATVWKVVEAIDTIKRQRAEDLVEMCYALGSKMMVLAKQAATIDEARVQLKEALESGKALLKFKEMIQNQGATQAWWISLNDC